jgi:hypothetical protein
MSRKPLIEILTGDLAYDPSWAIYAERIGGSFGPETRRGLWHVNSRMGG